MAEKFIRKPYIVEAWRITAPDLQDIAKWCNGKVRGMSITFPRIRDKSRPLDSQDRKAYALLGQVLIKTSKGFIVMDGEEFDDQHFPAKKKPKVEDGNRAV